MAELSIKAAEIADVLRRNLEDFTPGVTGEEVGRIRDIGDGIARITGLPNVAVNELLELEGGVERSGAQPRRGLDRRRRARRVPGLQEGQLVRATGRILSVPVGRRPLGPSGGLAGPAHRRARASRYVTRPGDWRCRPPASSPANP